MANLVANRFHDKDVFLLWWLSWHCCARHNSHGGHDGCKVVCQTEALHLGSVKLLMQTRGCRVHRSLLTQYSCQESWQVGKGQGILLQSFGITKVQPSLGRKGWQGQPWKGLDGNAETGSPKRGTLASYLRRERHIVRTIELEARTAAFFKNRGVPFGSDVSSPSNRVANMRKFIL